MCHEDSGHRSRNEEGSSCFSTPEKASLPEINSSRVFPDSYHYRRSGEIHGTKEYAAADLFPSGIIRCMSFPLAESQIGSLKSPFLTGKNFLPRFFSKKLCFVLSPLRMPGVAERHL
jgi:hypothetical protein